MFKFEIGDLVEVKKDNDLSPTLRFFYNKQGMISRVVSESKRGDTLLFIEWEVVFPNGKRAAFKNNELILISKANKKEENINEN